RGFSAEVISSLREAYKIVYRRGLSLDEARAELRARQKSHPGAEQALQIWLDFFDASSRGIIRPCACPWAWWRASPRATCWPAGSSRGCASATPACRARG